MAGPSDNVLSQTRRWVDPVALGLTAAKGGRPVQSDSTVTVQVALEWRSPLAVHTDCVYATGLNLWRDLFPQALQSALQGHCAGDAVALDYVMGELVPHNINLLKTPRSAFKRSFANQQLDPRVGRFYPKGIIGGVARIDACDMTPLRVCSVGEQLCVDLGHPLADKAVKLTCHVLEVAEGNRRGGVCQDVLERVAGHGPGMQGRLENIPTDFWSDNPFERLDTGNDDYFYTTPRFVDHVDRVASTQIGNLYRQLMPAGAAVLDLMAGWRSHIDTHLPLSRVVGLGLNVEELQANPRLSQYTVHDLNQTPALPFSNESFDTVVCSLSVEYLMQPLAVFEEVRRVLKTGGCFVVTFSNRWFPPKAIAIWSQLHEFERPGLVLEYFDRGGGFHELQTWSQHGLARAQGDKYAGKLRFSDPLHAVWGVKR